MMFVWYDMPKVYDEYIELLNYIFATIFTIEAIFKIIAYRRNYFREAWNKFDFTVVVLTWIVVILLTMDLPFDVAILGMVARTLRIGRVFRIVKRVPAIQIILLTLIEALPAISALGLLLGLLFFLYSIIGMSQFAFVKLSGELNYHVNFQSFFTGAILLMRNATGEAWDTIMFDYMRTKSILFDCVEDADYYTWKNNGEVTNGCGSSISVIFFYSFNVIVSQVFLNLFVAIIIDSFLGQS
jgi:voltage-dependent calcium channel L type alpha-1D